MKLEVTLLAANTETISFPSKKVAGQTDTYDKKTIQCLDNEGKIVVFRANDLTPFQAVPAFTKITVSVNYDLERAEFNNVKLLSEIPLQMGGLPVGHTYANALEPDGALV